MDPKDYMFKYNRAPWSLDDVIFIEQNYKKSYKDLKNTLINRSKSSINLKKCYIQKNGGIFYNIDKVYKEKYINDDLVLKTGHLLTATELGSLLGISLGSAYNTAKRLNVTLKKVKNNN